MMAINLKYLRFMLLMYSYWVVNFFFLGYNKFTSYSANLSASVDLSAKANQQARSKQAQRNARRVDLSTGHGPSNSKPCIALHSFSRFYIFVLMLTIETMFASLPCFLWLYSSLQRFRLLDWIINLKPMWKDVYTNIILLRVNIFRF